MENEKIEQKDEDTILRVLPESVTPAEINKQNENYWKQKSACEAPKDL